jgi:hypothetical protein
VRSEDFMTPMRCRERNRSGKPCAAPAGPNGLCVIHANPDLAKVLGAKGGRGNRPVVPDDPEIPLFAPRNAGDVRLALGRIMADVHNGKLDKGRATTVVYAGMAFIKALEVSELEARIDALERKANDAKKSS